MYYVYTLYNKKSDKIYIGQTENLEERLKLHKNRTFKSSFTARFEGEWALIYQEIATDRKKALLREKQLKSYQGRRFIKQFIPL